MQPLELSVGRHYSSDKDSRCSEEALFVHLAEADMPRLASLVLNIYSSWAYGRVSQLVAGKRSDNVIIRREVVDNWMVWAGLILRQRAETGFMALAKLLLTVNIDKLVRKTDWRGVELSDRSDAVKAVLEHLSSLSI